MEAQIGHHRRDHGVATQLALPFQMPGEDGDDEVAVHELAGGVDGEHAVAVAVESQAEVESVGRDDLLERADVRGTAARVDIGPVGLGEEHGDVGARLGERQRRRLRHGAVRAVEDDLHAAEIQRDAAHDVPHVTLDGSLQVLCGAEPVAGQRPQIVVRDVRLDLSFFLVAQLDAGAGEELDAVVGEGVVRGADDDAGVGATLVDQRGEPRRWDHAGDLHARAAASEAGHQARFEHRPRQARVAADHEQRVRAGLVRQHDRRRTPDLHGELGREQLAGYAADAVGAKVGAHGKTGPYARGWWRACADARVMLRASRRGRKPPSLANVTPGLAPSPLPPGGCAATLSTVLERRIRSYD